MASRNKYMHFLQIFNMSSFRDAKELGEMDPNVLKSQMYMFATTKKRRTARTTDYSDIHIWTNETLLIKLSGDNQIIGSTPKRVCGFLGPFIYWKNCKKMSTSLNFCMFMSFKTTILFFNPIFLLGVQAYITGGLPHIKASHKKIACEAGEVKKA